MIDTRIQIIEGILILWIRCRPSLSDLEFEFQSQKFIAEFLFLLAEMSTFGFTSASCGKSRVIRKLGSIGRCFEKELGG